MIGDAFAACRPRLLGIAYGLLGELTEAEDVVQDAWLRWEEADNNAVAARSITLDAAKILGIEGRVGSLEVGKDGDVALYDGDPFEYTTHCTGCVIEGHVVSEVKR